MQGADDPAVARRQAEQRPRAGRGREAIDDGLGDVGARVAGRDPVGVESIAQPLGRLVAGVAGHGLDVARRQQRALDVEVDPELGAEGARRPLVLVGVLAQPVVEVDRSHGRGTAERGQRRGGAGRVRPAGDEHDSARAWIQQSSRLDHVRQGLDSRRALHGADDRYAIRRISGAGTNDATSTSRRRTAPSAPGTPSARRRRWARGRGTRTSRSRRPPSASPAPRRPALWR